jgi:membrane protein YdbS with pleckstrin-like domain
MNSSKRSAAAAGGSASSGTERASAGVYRGIWVVLVDLFRVPREAPPLPVLGGGEVRSIRPARGFLRYLKFLFWIVLTAFDGAIIVAWLAVTVAAPIAGAILAVPVWAIAVLPDIVAYIAIHLRYDTTWYVLSERSMRIRRGIWTIHETTITYENVQNVVVRQGPLQRYFGIAVVVVQTAGGGGGTGHEGGKGQSATPAHVGLLEGLDNAAEVRDLILARIRGSRAGGLGDEAYPGDAPWSAEHIETLREIRDLARTMAR